MGVRYKGELHRDIKNVCEPLHRFTFVHYTVMGRLKEECLLQNYSAEEPCSLFSVYVVNDSNRKWCLVLKNVILRPFIINTQYFLLLNGCI